MCGKCIPVIEEAAITTVDCSELRKGVNGYLYIREMGAAVAVCIVACSKKNRIVLVGFFFVLLLFGNWIALANSHHSGGNRYT